MTEKELKDSVRSPEGAYFFFGDEDYLKEFYIKAIRRAVILDESVADFNVVTLHDDTFTPAALEDALASPPLMSEKKLVLVKLSAFSFGSEKKEKKDGGDTKEKKENKELKEITRLISEVPSDTVLVFSVSPDGFDAGTEKRPTSVMKAVSSVAKTVNFPLSQEPKLVRWLARHFSERGVASDEASLRYMIKLCGRSMHRLSAEAEKVASRALASGIPAVSLSLIDSTVTVTPEEEAFRLTNSILKGDTEGALETLCRAKKRKEDPIKLLASVTSLLCNLSSVAHMMEEGLDLREMTDALKIHEYQVKLAMGTASRVSADAIDEAFAMCVEAEKKMKSMSLGYVPLERLICSIKLG